VYCVGFYGDPGDPGSLPLPLQTILIRHAYSDPRLFVFQPCFLLTREIRDSCHLAE
jgi:hypothetical protein